MLELDEFHVASSASTLGTKGQEELTTIRIVENYLLSTVARNLHQVRKEDCNSNGKEMRNLIARRY
jgi:hypothetical protein